MLLTRKGVAYPGFSLCGSVEEVLQKAEKAPRTMVIGGGSVYRQLLPYCDIAYVTKLHTRVPCDTWFPNLDQDPDWVLEELLGSGEEAGIGYEFCRYVRKRAE